MKKISVLMLFSIILLQVGCLGGSQAASPDQVPQEGVNPQERENTKKEGSTAFPWKPVVGTAVPTVIAAGGIGAYFGIPSFKAWVNGTVAKVTKWFEKKPTEESKTGEETTISEEKEDEATTGKDATGSISKKEEDEVDTEKNEEKKAGSGDKSGSGSKKEEEIKPVVEVPVIIPEIPKPLNKTLTDIDKVIADITSLLPSTIKKLNQLETKDVCNEFKTITEVGTPLGQYINELRKGVKVTKTEPHWVTGAVYTISNFQVENERTTQLLTDIWDNQIKLIPNQKEQATAAIHIFNLLSFKTGGFYVFVMDHNRDQEIKYHLLNLLNEIKCDNKDKIVKDTLNNQQIKLDSPLFKNENKN